ncbi:APC family permease [Dyella sp. ASV21]|uniref:APC family permease n=1 Tax=Dyella sp. ASV21 TaxID=2795114 RepID=UPI0018EDCEB8|nr:APC family permease [Dyella sp. ASV21]
MSTTSPNEMPRLRRVLGTWDLVLFNIAAIVALRWLSIAAQVGPSSIALWVLGLIGFFIPLALAVLDLSARIPGQGGLYLWTKAAFGDVHGFIAGWTYWVSNLAYFPTALLFSAGIFLHVGGEQNVHLASDAGYNLGYCLVVLWLATLLGILGLERAKWLQNIGGIATWSAAAIILLAGAWAAYRFDGASALITRSWVPDFGRLSTYATLVTIALAFQGLELGPIMGGEICDPERRIPRATLISCAVIAAIYIMGTAALLVALPTSTIDIISGIPQALSAIGARMGLPWFGALTAALVTIGTIGAIAAWVTGTARLPFVVGVDRFLPAMLGRLHPRFGTPHIALLVQGVLTSLMLVAALSGASIHEAYIILIDMTAVMSLLPLTYILLAYPLLRSRAAALPWGGRMLLVWLAGLSGFAVVITAIITSMIPPEHGNTILFLCKVVGGSGFLIGVGLAFYARARWSARRPAAPSVS